MEVAAEATVFINDDNVVALADFKEVIAALSHAYAQEILPEMVPPRIMARGQGYWLRSLCAVSPSKQYMGCKLIAASPKNKKASYLISLFDQETMRLAALIDGNRITDIRTAASSAVAVAKLAADETLNVAILGSSAVAKGHLHALYATERVQAVRVFSPTMANRDKFAQEFKAQYPDLDIAAASSAAEAVAFANVVVCASRSKDNTPVFDAAWLKPGMTVVSVSSTLPEQRELDVASMVAADLMVADMVQEVLHETGDALEAAQAGHDLTAKTVSLADVMSGKHAGRSHAEQIVIYKSVGSALQDIVTAEMLLKSALHSEKYTDMPQSIVTINR